VLDPRITLSEHTKAISKSCFYRICALKHIHDSLDTSMIHTIAAALVTCRLDYANSVLYGIPTKYISPPAYSDWKYLARVVAGSRTPCSSLATLSQLHLLPVHDRIKFKIATMTHKVIYTGNLPPHMWLIWSSRTLHAENSMVCLCHSVDWPYTIQGPSEIDHIKITYKRL